MYPVAVRQAVKLGGNPQVGGLFTTGGAGPAVAGVGDVFHVVAAGIIAAIFLHAADAGAAGEHFCDGLDFDIAQTTRIKKRSPALVGSEERFERVGLEAVSSGEGHLPAFPLRWYTNRNGDRSGRTTRSATVYRGKDDRSAPRNTECRTGYCRRRSQRKQMDMKSYSDGLRL
ncbi:hypothetical protein D3C76_905580 [compost metagenome]